MLDFNYFCSAYSHVIFFIYLLQIMVRERKDIMVVRFPMRTRSNMKLRSYKLFGEGGTRRKLIRVLFFRNKPSVRECQPSVRIHYKGNFYDIDGSDAGTLARFI